MLTYMAGGTVLELVPGELLYVRCGLLDNLLDLLWGRSDLNGGHLLGASLRHEDHIRGF